MKVCKHCEQQFEKRCKPCHAATMRQWRKDNPERAREISRKGYRKWADANQGLKRERANKWARENYNPESAKQARQRHALKKLGLSETDVRPEPKCCECCGGPPTARKGLCIDHCPVTNTFRGWLCNNCNGGIGLLGDNMEGLNKAVSYLRIDK